MKKYKKITAAALIIAAVLALSFCHGKTPAVKEQSAGISEITEKTQTDNEKAPETKPQNQPEKAEEQEKSSGQNMQEDTVADEYKTDPAPEDKPQPEEPQNADITENVQTCTLSVRCDTILKNIDMLDPEKIELVPRDGVIFEKKEVAFYEGESVFNLLLREMKKNKIHMEFVNTPVYNSAYIEGIANLYEFDCGGLSGWMYRVNGWFPNYGCSRYALKQGDDVEWVYTCDLGKDIGGEYAAGEGQKDE